MANNKFDKSCRVCGLIQDETPWGEDGNSPSFEFCSCCGVEFGYQDCTLDAAKHFRYFWIKEGARWIEVDAKPSNWSLEEQLKNIPEEFK